MNEPFVPDLSPPTREIERARSERSFLADRLGQARARAMDLWLRALVSETPLADQAHRIAAAECRRIEDELDRAEERLEGLIEGARAGTVR